jgi:short-subunit dehydrogenase
MAAKKRVLITGAGGRIGRILHETLGHTYDLSGVERRQVSLKSPCKIPILPNKSLNTIRAALH